MLRSSLLYLFTVLLLFSLTGCDSTGPDDTIDLDVEEGSYAVNITGDLPGTSSGEAIFEELPSDHEDGPAFGVVFTGMTADEEPFQLYLYRASERPAPGTYSFVQYDYDEDDVEEAVSSEEFLLFGYGFSFGTGDEASGYHVGSQAGTLTILESSEERVAGTFTVEAKGVVFSGDEEQQVSGNYEGEFVAQRGSISPLE